ncbi:hypothetical protein ACFYWS_26015 [Streptomyces sp. NPDC002795]|uniref:hypothetical protein n=1 Tax=Streptomyces sp. NPDC002795 TaxID=3364665 RepID=UPI0036C327A5
MSGDLDLAIEDAEAGLFDDHGDGLARVRDAGTELLAGNGEGAVGSDTSDCPQRLRRGRRQWGRGDPRAGEFRATLVRDRWGSWSRPCLRSSTPSAARASTTSFTRTARAP